VKESDITPKIIEKSKELAEYWRMELAYGSWVAVHFSKLGLAPLLFDGEWSSGVPSDSLYHEKTMELFQKDKWFPIPSISDCLEKLRELSISIHLSDTARVNIEDVEYFNGSYVVRGIKFRKYWFLNNPHEALLSALLEVLNAK